MAFTYAKIQETVLGNLRCWVGTLTFDTSYPTGGLAYTNASFGLQSNPVFIGFDSDASGYGFQHDRANGKILAYRGAGFTPAGTNSTPTVTVTEGAVTVVGGAIGEAIGINPDSNAGVLSKAAATNRTIPRATLLGTATTAALSGAPTFTGTAVAAAAAVEVANAVNLSAIVVNVFVLGI